jgi:putative hydrolase of the HAD superfamily
MLLLFDIDDTLLDHKSAERAAATHLHRHVGSQDVVDVFLTRWSTALDRHYERYLAGAVSLQQQRRDRLREVVDTDLTDDAADRLFAEYAAGYETAWSLFDDAIPCLDGLAAYRLGVISNGHGEQQRRKLSQTGILDRFECVVISDDFGRARPDPAIFLHACDQFGESPANAVYVGDRYDVDARAARAAGLRGIWLDRRLQARAEHLPPIIPSLRGLRSIIESATSPNRNGPGQD